MFSVSLSTSGSIDSGMNSSLLSSFPLPGLSCLADVMELLGSLRGFVCLISGFLFFSFECFLPALSTPLPSQKLVFARLLVTFQRRNDRANSDSLRNIACFWENYQEYVTFDSFKNISHSNLVENSVRTWKIDQSNPLTFTVRKSSVHHASIYTDQSQ